MLAFAVALIASRVKTLWWLVITVAVGVTCAVEIVLKVAEYFVKDTFHTTAYYDSLVDNTSTFVGALLGAGIGVALAARLRRRRTD